MAYDSPLDGYYVRHPELLLRDPPAAAAGEAMSGAGAAADATDGAAGAEAGRPLAPTNPYVLGFHLLCAAAELPLRLAAPGWVHSPLNRAPSSTPHASLWLQFYHQERDTAQVSAQP